MVFGLVGGMLLWARNALQSTVARAARCSAISSPLCADVPNYTVNLASAWTMPGVISPSDVRVTTVNTCNSAGGTFRKVEIATSFWANVLPPPFHDMTLKVSACHPTL
jgi:hypothetical protein